MKRMFLLAAVAGVLMLAFGCAFATTNGVFAPIMNEKSFAAVGDTNAGQSKMGTGQAEGIVVYAWGDTSISAACNNAAGGPITRIHHVDTEELSVLGFYARKIVKVYGE